MAILGKSLTDLSLPFDRMMILVKFEGPALHQNHKCIAMQLNKERNGHGEGGVINSLVDWDGGNSPFETSFHLYLRKWVALKRAF